MKILLWAVVYLRFYHVYGVSLVSLILKLTLWNTVLGIFTLRHNVIKYMKWYANIFSDIGSNDLLQGLNSFSSWEQTSVCSKWFCIKENGACTQCHLKNHIRYCMFNNHNSLEITMYHIFRYITHALSIEKSINSLKMNMDGIYVNGMRGISKFKYYLIFIEH
jgi:hypothetical protein